MPTLFIQLWVGDGVGHAEMKPLGLFQVLLLAHPLLDVSGASRATSLTVPGAALGDQPSKALEVAISRCVQSGCLVPRTSLLPHPLQDSQVTMIGGFIAHMVCNPRTAVLSRPLQAFQMTVRSGHTAHVFIPRAPLAPQPLQGLQVTATGYPYTSPRIKSGILSSGTSLQ